MDVLFVDAVQVSFQETVLLLEVAVFGLQSGSLVMELLVQVELLLKLLLEGCHLVLVALHHSFVLFGLLVPFGFEVCDLGLQQGLVMSC